MSRDAISTYLLGLNGMIQLHFFECIFLVSTWPIVINNHSRKLLSYYIKGHVTNRKGWYKKSELWYTECVMWWGGNREFRKEIWGCRAPFREEEMASDQVLMPKHICNQLLFWSSLLSSFLATMTALDWALQFYPHSHPFFSTKG